MKHPGTHIVYQQSIAQSTMEAKKGFLRDLLGERVPASQREQISQHRVAQFEEPSLDFFSEMNRSGIWRRDIDCLLPGGSALRDSVQQGTYLFS